MLTQRKTHLVEVMKRREGAALRVLQLLPKEIDGCVRGEHIHLIKAGGDVLAERVVVACLERAQSQVRTAVVNVPSFLCFSSPLTPQLTLLCVGCG